GDYQCEFLEDGSICLSEYIGHSSDVTIPSKIYGRDVTMIGGGYGRMFSDELTSVNIPDSVTKIGAYTFSDCSSLTFIDIPDKVVSIDNNAFEYCSSLTSIEIPDKVVSIGESAFKGCGALTSLEIPEGVSIGESAFDGCDAMTSIEFSNGVSIGELAFAGCNSLTSIDIPDGVTSISGGAFGFCSSLSSINVNTENENYTSIDGALYSKDESELLCYPAGKTETSFIIPKDVTSLGDYAFADCTSLTSIEIPNSVTSIGMYTFGGCTSLTSIEIPDSVTSIGVSAFRHCTSLTSIEIPNKVTSIENYVFSGCTSLTMVEIPDSVTSIGYGAFYGCRSLTAVVIPDSVTSIIESEKYPEKFPDAFADCSPNLIIYGKEGSYAETYAKRKDIEFKPIEEFPPETPIDPDPDDDPVSVTIGDYTVYFTEDNGALTITDITGSGTNLMIPAEINGKPVKAISETAFANAEDIQSVYIPDSVDSIEGNPFAACPDLTDIYYGGTENKWYIAASGIPFEDDPLPNVTFHFGVSDGLSEDHPVKEAGKETVETAIKFNTGEGAPVIYIEGNQAVISEEGLAVIKALNTPVILQMKNYSLKINPDDIKTPSDFSILVKTADSSDNIEQWADPANSLMIIPQKPAEGDFGMTVEINLSEDILPFSVDSAPYFYHIDGNDNIEDYSSAVSCDKDSKVISVSLSHASKYLLTASAVDLGEDTSGGSESTEPTVPTEPTNPTEPPEPTVPTEPTNPTEPPEPTVPTEPTNPTESSEPTVPTEPTNPTESSEPTVPTDPTNPSDTSEPADSTDPTNPTEPSVPTTTRTPIKFVVPETTTSVITADTFLENTAAATINSSNGSAFSVEFESEETAEATVTAEEAQPVTIVTSSAASTTVPPDEAEVSLDTTNSSTGNSGVANAPIGNVGADEAQEEKNLNTGDSSVSLTPLMIISAAVVFNGTALFGKKKEDK
ncbi:MAG: leucine-rich repeat protein, partial [Ruminococcaceae bacterium]|nr:leucine-rich repeat protein [Oscillospiraceae bacterium]